MDHVILCRSLLERSLGLFPQELNELDWKLQLSPNQDKMVQHLSAFSNHPNGGFLVFGIDDHGTAMGIMDASQKNITQKLANLARNNLDPAIALEILPIEYQGKNLLAIYIPESPLKPVHVKGKSIEHSYIRAGGTSRQMSKEEIRRAILLSHSPCFEELPATLSASVQDDWSDLFDFSEVIKRTRPTGFSDRSFLLEHLHSLRLLAKTSSGYIPTNLCVLCCARSVQNFPGYEKFAVRITEYGGASRISAKRETFFEQGYTLCLDNIVGTVVSWLPHNEIIKQATRISEPLIPEIAIREMVVNSIMHRDFTNTSRWVTIEMFHDRIEITNPGNLLSSLSTDRIIDQPSESRNNILADFFRKLKFAEELGSGYDKTVDALELYGSPPIGFQGGENYFRVVLYAPKPYKNMTKDERIMAVYQHACLNVVSGKRTTNESVRNRFKLNQKHAGIYISKLFKEALQTGRIKLANPEEGTRAAHYLPYWA